MKKLRWAIFPFYEQGSFALLLAGDRGDLLRMPVTKPEANLIDISVDATLDADGKLAVSFINSKTGQPASMERHLAANENPDQYKASYQRNLGDRAKGAVISKILPDDHFEQNKFDLRIDFDSPNYGQTMQGRLLVFNPAVLGIPRFVAPPFPKDEKRVSPIVLRAALYRKTVRVRLPAGFTVDEAPSAAKFETNFGKFSRQLQTRARHAHDDGRTAHRSRHASAR